jgi:large subunit ribosomal protein L35
LSRHDIKENVSMPKIKTNRGAAKRFRKTGSGKIRRNKAFTSHILTKKSTKRKRDLRQGTLVAKADEKNISRLIPYV